jgi:maltose 6'-phosphate phosphatase
MQHIKILYIENTISRTPTGMWQNLSFMVRVDNLSYEKQVVINWCGEDGVWHTENAAYYCTLPDRREQWLLRIKRPLTADHSLPGNIRFAASYTCQGQTFSDNNGGRNYRVDADCGVVVYSNEPVQHLFYNPVLQGGKVTLPIDSAVQASLKARRVRILWSADHWETTHTAPCTKQTNHWELQCASAARNPNRYGWEVWSGQIPLDQTYRIEYIIECETEQEIFRDDCAGTNYQSRRSTLRVMTLNLHCYQEKNQQEKFKLIAKAIKDHNIDLICLQEVAENWNDGHGDWESNSAHIINSHLSSPYHLHTDFSHLGFDRYREGVAILSRYEFTNTDSGYVSDSSDIYDINSRRVVMAQVHVPYFGPVNLFCAHLSWPEGGFYNQFDRLRVWADQQHGPHVAATLLCGDFNIAAGSKPYAHIVHTREYEDQYLKGVDLNAFERIYLEPDPDTEKILRNDGRIDYIFLKNNSQLRLLDALELFNGKTYGRVSDHTGYYAEFELA